MRYQDKNYLTVGEVAEIVKKKKKQLRNYDEMGVFCPAYRNAETGYRYYTDTQLPEIFLIRDLRFYGMSLEQIGKILTSCEDIYDVCEELEEHQWITQQKIAQLQHELSQTGIQLARIREALLCQAQPGIQRIHVKPFETLNTRVLWNPVRDGYRVLSWELSTLLNQARKQRVDATDNIVILRGDYMRQFEEDGEGCRLEALFGWIIKPPVATPEFETLGGFEALSIPSYGTNEQKRLRYEELLRYAEKHGIELDDYCMERQILGSGIARGADKSIVRIYLPIKR